MNRIYLGNGGKWSKQGATSITVKRGRWIHEDHSSVASLTSSRPTWATWTSISKQTNKIITGLMALRWFPFDCYIMFLFHFEYFPISSEAEFWSVQMQPLWKQGIKKKINYDAAVTALGPPVARVSDWWMTSVSQDCTIRLGYICMQTSLWPLHLASFFRFWSCKWPHSCSLGSLPRACWGRFHVQIYMETYFVN